MPNDIVLDSDARVDVTVRAQTVDEESRSVEALVATGNPTFSMNVRTLDAELEALDLGGGEWGDQVPLLEGHGLTESRFSTDTILGSVRSIARGPEGLVARLHFSSDDLSNRRWLKVRDGHLTDVSAGYARIERVRVSPGDTMVVNGRSYTAPEDEPLFVVTKWRLKEVSLVRTGADEATKIRAKRQRKIMNKKLRSALENLGLRADADESAAWTFLSELPEEKKDKLAEEFGIRADRQEKPEDDAVRAAGNPSSPPPQDPPPATQRGDDAVRAAAEAVRAERQRVSAIRSAAGDDVPAEMVERAIDEGWDMARANSEFLQSIRANRSQSVGQGPAIHDRSGDRSQINYLAGGLMIRLGLDKIRDACYTSPKSDLFGRASREQQEQAFDRGHKFARWPLAHLCAMTIRASGRSVPDDYEDMIRAAFSTPDLDSVFTTSVNAALVESFMAASDTTDWVRVTDFSDFKTHDRIRLGKTSALEKLPRGGNAAHDTIADVQESYKIARYARQFTIDEQDIIDDRLNAFTDMPREMGMAAGRLRPDLVYAILLANAALDQDSVTLFHSDHNNTATDALAASALEAGVIAMSGQREDTIPLNLRPAYLIVPPDLEFTAKVLLRSISRDHDGADGIENPLRDLGLQLRVDARLDATGLVDPSTNPPTARTGSATNWFLSASPNMAPTVEVAYRAGTGRRPQLRSSVLTQGSYGINYDVNMDIGAKALGYRGLYRGNT